MCCLSPRIDDDIDRVYRLMLTSIFSAGNTYTYAAVRTLYGLALEGRAPKVLTKCNRKGVPIYCFCVVMVFPLFAFLQCSNNSSVVITWFASLVTGGGKGTTSWSDLVIWSS